MAKLLERLQPDPSGKDVVLCCHADGVDGADGGRYYDIDTLSKMKHALTLLARQ